MNIGKWEGLHIAVFILCALLAAHGQTPSASVVPQLVNYSGIALDAQGKPMEGMAGVTFSIYSEQYSGVPLWMETQNVIANGTGNYSVQLGAATWHGLPLDLFTSGDARWLGVRINGGEEQPRVLLLSVPYALKAADAQTLGGLPASAFALAAPGAAATGNSSPAASSPPTQSTAAPNSAITGSGTLNFLPLWDNASDITSSVLFQSGNGANAKIGINTTTPASTLDIKGGATVRGTLALPSIGTASSNSGKISQAQKLSASVFNSGTGTAVSQNFQWQAEPVGNNTSSASGTLNLLYSSGSNSPAETGLKIANNGQLTFAEGQTFPGTGDGTVTSVSSGAGLTGGPITTTGTIGIANAGVTNSMLANSSLTVKAGTNLTGGGAVSLGGTTTLNVDTTKIPQLSTANTFTGNQTTNGNLTATGVVSASSYQIGSALFAYGSSANQNAYLGFAGSTTSTGSYNTAVGYAALPTNTSDANTAIGSNALYKNTTGYGNTATGASALAENTTGSENTATGALALLSIGPGGSYNTATGYGALATDSTGSYNTATGAGALDLNSSGYSNTGDGYDVLTYNTTGAQNTGGGLAALYSNTSGGDNTAYGFDALYDNTTGTGNTAVGALALDAVTTSNYVTCIGFECSPANGLSNATAIGAFAKVEQSDTLVLGGIGDHAVRVGIGTTKPSNVLTVARGAGHPVSDSWETYSSRRWKTNIKTLPDALTRVERLRGVSYDLKDSGKHEIGVIAEEVGAVVPEVVSYELNGRDASGVDYSRLTALLIEAVKQQQKQIAAQREQICEVLNKDRLLEVKLSRVQRKVDQLQQLHGPPSGSDAKREMHNKAAGLRRSFQ